MSMYLFLYLCVLLLLSRVHERLPDCLIRSQELAKIRGETSRELEEIRNAGAGAMDREIRTLRESRAEAENQCRQLRGELGSLKAASEDAAMAAMRRQVSHVGVARPFAPTSTPSVYLIHSPTKHFP